VPLHKHTQAVGEHLEAVYRSRVGPHAVQREHFMNRTKAGPRTGNTLPEIPVLTRPERGVESADGFDECAAYHAGMDSNGAVARENGKEII
jgi:hypothetical protein